jgi:uncharacterized delta-60 repeat protein
MKKILLLLVPFFIATQASAQAGTNDDSFDPGAGASSWVNTTAIQSDGKIIIGGIFTSYDSIGRNHIARLNTDGTLDTTFNPGAGANSSVNAIAIQLDGKIIIGGFFTSYGGIGRNRIARLNTDGTLDSTFNPGTGADSTVFCISLQNGKIIIGGMFREYNGTNRNYIARLNADGMLDSTFIHGIGADNWIKTTVVQSNGEIIIGGDFTSYHGIVRNRIARLNVDGILDTAFNPGTGANDLVNTTALQPNGKIIIGGYFTKYNGAYSSRIARLNTDGMLDTTFNTIIGANNYVNTTVILPNGKIIIGGYFTKYYGTGRKGIARLNDDGTLDTTFNPGTGMNGSVVTAALQPNGKIIIGGNFTYYYDSATNRNRVARVNSQ